MDLYSKTRLEFEQINTKSNEVQYRANVVTKRNYSWLNNIQRLQPQSWRANWNIQEVIDHYACIEYLTKCAAKGDQSTPILKAAFTTILNNAPSNSNPHRAIKQIVMKTLGERDYAAQETMHHLLSLKLHSSSLTVIPVSLNGSHRFQISVEERQLRCSNSLLDVYANRAQYVDKKFTKLPDNVVPRTFPTYSFNPNGPNFAQYCKYQASKIQTLENITR